MQTPRSEQPILELSEDDPELADRIASRLQDYARNQYLRRLDLSAPELPVRLEVLPVKLDGCQDPASPTCESCRAEELPLGEYTGPGGELRLPIGTVVKLRVQPPPQKRVFMAVLDLQPDGAIGVLWPPPGRREQAAAGVTRELPGCWRLGPPTGVEVFLLVASEAFVEFQSLRTLAPGAARGPLDRGSLGAFAPLFDDDAIRSRGAIDLRGEGTTSTHALVFELAPER